MEKIIQWAEGNPGALIFLMELLRPENLIKSTLIFQRLDKLKSIRGTNLYVLWSDLCNRDISKVEQLCNNCPKNILESACNRQDYSGRELVAKYLTNKNEK